MPDLKPCEICGRPAELPRFRPFCSARCADVDLGRWFNGGYRMPGPPPELDENALDDLDGNSDRRDT